LACLRRSNPGNEARGADDPIICAKDRSPQPTRPVNPVVFFMPPGDELRSFAHAIGMEKVKILLFVHEEWLRLARTKPRAGFFGRRVSAKNEEEPRTIGQGLNALSHDRLGFRVIADTHLDIPDGIHGDRDWILQLSTPRCVDFVTGIVQC